MKLAALGGATLAIGAILQIPGLLGIGAWWVVTGYVARRHADTLKAVQPAVGTAAAGKPQIDRRTFALGTLLWVALGVPSLVVGIWGLGIDGEHQDWRWLPLVVGGVALGIGVISAVLYLLGSVLLPAGGVPSHPATLWIRALKETGTYVNERPRLEFELHVEPETSTGLPPYDVTKKATVPYTAMGSLKVGNGFKALVAGPEEPTSMEIHWDQPVSAEPPDVTARLETLEQLRRDAKISSEEYEAQRQRILGSL